MGQMTTMKFNVTDTITPKLTKLQQAFGEPMLNAVGQIALRDVLLNFKTSGGNIGRSWRSLAPFTLSRRRGGSSTPLQDSNLLVQSIKPVTKLAERKVEIQTNRFATDRHGKKWDLAWIHNSGVKPYTPTRRQVAWFRHQGVYLTHDAKMHIPKREFMRMSNPGKREVMTLPARMVKHL
jgi:phage gpG-like protein